MAKRFPESYGSMDIMSYPKSQYLAVTLPGESKPQPCIVLPVSSNWVRLYSDKNQKVHADLSVSIDDASALNQWTAEEAAKKGKNHTNFHGQIHLTPNSDARKTWKASKVAEITNQYNTDPNAFEQRASAFRLDSKSIQESRYYQEHLDKVPTIEQRIERVALEEMKRATACGRIYSPSLDEQVPAPVASSPAAATPLDLPQQPSQQSAQTPGSYASPAQAPNPFSSSPVQQSMDFPPAPAGTQPNDDLPF